VPGTTRHIIALSEVQRTCKHDDMPALTEMVESTTPKLLPKIVSVEPPVVGSVVGRASVTAGAA
jgi:hypothetical protein